MITGRDNLQLLNQHVYQAQAEQEQAGRRLEELHQQLNALRLKTGESYRELARLRMDDLKASVMSQQYFYKVFVVFRRWNPQRRST